MSDQPEPSEDEHEDVPGGDRRGIPGPRDSTVSKRTKVRDGVREARSSDLSTALTVHGRLCDQIEKAGSELRSALNAARRLENAERNVSPGQAQVSSSIKDVLDAVRSIASMAYESAVKTGNSEKGLLRDYEAVCLRVDSASRELHKALALAALLDKSSGSGFNFEARLGRRLDVKGLQRTISTAHSQVTRASRTARIRAESHGRVVEDLIEEMPVGFE